MLGGGLLIFHVDGLPIPQGSVNTFGTRHVTSVSPKLRQWRAAVNAAALAAYGDNDPNDQPAIIMVNFYLPRPDTPKFHVPGTKPDGDKLLRAVQDAVTNRVYRKVLQQRGVVTDDARFIKGTFFKQYAVGDGKPGADVWINWNVPSAAAWNSGVF